MNDKVPTHKLLEQTVEAEVLARVLRRGTRLAHTPKEIPPGHNHGRDNDSFIFVEPSQWDGQRDLPEEE